MRFPLPSTILLRGPLVAAGIVGILSWAAARITGRGFRDLPSWTLTLLAFLAVSWTGVAFWAPLTARYAPAETEVAVEALIREILDKPRGPLPDTRRDVYVIILDGMGHSDVLRREFDLDVRDIVGVLRAKGFAVPSGSRSAYNRTWLSLASTLNFQPLDRVLATLDPHLLDLSPMSDLIYQNALQGLAQAQGYNLVTVSSAYPGIDAMRGPGACDCSLPFPNWLEHHALRLTPLVARTLPIEEWTHAALRRKIRSTLEQLSASPRSPQFVVAHVSAPHPPFVFMADGQDRHPPVLFSFHKAPLRFEQVYGYREQARFVLGQVVEVVDTLLSRPGPAPVIVVQSDHGPRTPLTGHAARDLDILFGTFTAYYFPGVTESFPDDLSPMNGLRALATHYLGVDLPPLPDPGHWASFDEPYALTRFIPGDLARSGEATAAER